MAYSDFTLDKAIKDFELNIVEVPHFLDGIMPTPPDTRLQETLQETLPLALAQGNEKARSEWIISPILTAVRRLMNQQIALFSGKEFNVDPTRGLNGYVDFMLSGSARLLITEAPIITIVEAKPENLNAGLGQCVAEMVAAQQFNQREGCSIHTVYGCVTSGELWRFLKLERQVATIDLQDYAIPPVDLVLGILVWIVSKGQSDHGDR
jgi:hypothetical protein